MTKSTIVTLENINLNIEINRSNKSTKWVKALKEYRHPLGITLKARVIVLPVITSALLTKLTMNLICVYTSLPTIRGGPILNLQNSSIPISIFTC